MPISFPPPIPTEYSSLSLSLSNSPLPSRLAERIRGRSLQTTGIPLQVHRLERLRDRFVVTHSLDVRLHSFEGTAVVTDRQALLWTDGRYFQQAEEELDRSLWTLMREGTKDVPNINKWLIQVHLSSLFPPLTSSPFPSVRCRIWRRTRRSASIPSWSRSKSSSSGKILSTSRTCSWCRSRRTSSI